MNDFLQGRHREPESNAPTDNPPQDAQQPLEEVLDNPAPKKARRQRQKKAPKTQPAKPEAASAKTTSAGKTTSGGKELSGGRPQAYGQLSLQHQEAANTGSPLNAQNGSATRVEGPAEQRNEPQRGADGHSSPSNQQGVDSTAVASSAQQQVNLTYCYENCSSFAPTPELEQSIACNVTVHSQTKIVPALLGKQ